MRPFYKSIQFIAPLLAFTLLPTVQAAATSYECQTNKHFIRVSGLQDGPLLYQAWKDQASSRNKPELELSKGQRIVEGTGPCRYQRFTFTNGPYRYEVGELGCTDGSEPQNAVGRLRVSKGDKLLSEQWCESSPKAPIEPKSEK